MLSAPEYLINLSLQVAVNLFSEIQIAGSESCDGCTIKPPGVQDPGKLGRRG